MDKVAQLTANADINALKEPRGFIRLLEFILAIFAFATTTSPSSYTSFTVTCGTAAPIEQRLSFSYPYNLQSNTFQVPFCNATNKEDSTPYGNFQSSAEFYVFVGVMAFLYCIGIVVLYVLFDEMYRKNDKIPIIDFVATAVFAVLWLIASSAWAQGLTDLKFYSNPQELFESGRVPKSDCTAPNSCAVGYEGNFASLNVSIIFGFLNMGVWAGNLWFLYKETKWFKVQEKPVAPPQPVHHPEYQEYPGQPTPAMTEDPQRV